MDAMKVDTFLISNAKYFPPETIPLIKDRLLAIDDNHFARIYSVSFKDPMMIFVISLFAGVLGVDRFLLGDIGIGVLKLLTAGVCGILAVFDWFTIMKRTREHNYQLLISTLL